MNIVNDFKLVKKIIKRKSKTTTNDKVNIFGECAFF